MFRLAGECILIPLGYKGQLLEWICGIVNAILIIPPVAVFSFSMHLLSSSSPCNRFGWLDKNITQLYLDINVELSIDWLGIFPSETIYDAVIDRVRDPIRVQ